MAWKNSVERLKRLIKFLFKLAEGNVPVVCAETEVAFFAFARDLKEI